MKSKLKSDSVRARAYGARAVSNHIRVKNLDFSQKFLKNQLDFLEQITGKVKENRPNTHCMSQAALRRIFQDSDQLFNFQR